MSNIYKSWENFENHPLEICYCYWRGDFHPDEPYELFTREDLEQLVREFANEHNLPIEKLEEKVRRLFDLLDWQYPATLLDEALRDHTIWDEEYGEWDNVVYEPGEDKNA